MNIVDELYSKIDSGREGKNIGLKTGLPKLDFYLGGFKKAVYTLVFSKSSVGKTAYVIYKLYRILKDYPDRKIKIVYFSLEISASTLLAKILCLYLEEVYGIQITYMQLLSFINTLPDDLYKYVQEAKEWLQSVSDKFIIYDKQLNADSFYAAMMELHKELGTFSKSDDGKRTVYKPKDPDLMLDVVVDHLLLVNPQKGRTKKEEMDLISTYCVRFRELCQTSFDIIAQENRQAGSVDRRKMDLQEPTLDDIQATSEPAQASDVCIALFSPLKSQLKSYHGYRVIDNEDGPGMGSALRSAIILKNRYGMANKLVMLGFQGAIGKFVEIPKPDQIDYSLYQSWKDEKLEDQNIKDTSIKDENKVKFSF